MSTMKERLHTGELYLPGDEEILEEQFKCLDRLCDYNLTRPSEQAKRESLLKEMFAEIGPDCYIEPPFHANFGGKHVHFGRNVYANFNLTCVDDTHIYVGDYTMFGPNVTVATAGHPILPELREKAYQYNMPVHIGRNCWIGAGAIILPGITTWRQRSGRRRQRGHQGSALQRGGCGQPLQNPAGGRRARQGILF